jgi:fermentation-respiration switch protein FrsA (DUF1100 family)
VSVGAHGDGGLDISRAGRIAVIVLKWLLIVVALGYLGVVAALYVKQREMLFPIPTVARTAPDATGFAQAEEQLLATADGEKIIVWHVPAKPGRRVVLYFPGNGDSLAGSAGRFRNMVADGTGLIALSYRGYAGSSGHPSEHGLLLDAAATYAFAASRYETGRMIAWGYSLGTGVAIALAAEHPFGGLILEAPYTSITDVAAAAFPFLPVRLLLKDRFASDTRIERVTAPLLIMHGTADATVPIAFGERLFALAHDPKRFVRFVGGRHDNLDNFGATETARQFIAGLKG